MDKGRDARAILMNMHKVKLNKGFIGVVCRSQKDIDENKSLSDAFEDEKNFFNNHSKYKNITHKTGIENLQKFLQKELSQHLIKGLPTLKNS